VRTGKEKENKKRKKRPSEAERAKRYRQKDVGAKFRVVVTVQPVGALPHVPTTWERTRARDGMWELFQYLPNGGKLE
jgi:hypothetical protein